MMYSNKASINTKNIRNNYRLVYFDMVSPKIIYSGIDSNAVFYKLKNIYSKSFFINDQYGISKVTGKGWPNNFYWEIKKYNKKNKKKASADIIFVFGSNEKGRLKPIIDAKYYIIVWNLKLDYYMVMALVAK